MRRYVAAAAAHRIRIRFVTETHIHADFLSGSRELSRETRATLLLSGHGGADWSYDYAEADGARLVRDGESIDVGSVRLTVRHTPGHTPEHISFLVTDTAVGDRPMGMITGDFVFVGDVGRPDLLEKAAKLTGSMEGAARQLYASLQKLTSFPDYLQLWPGHGAGSACGKALGAVPQTTLGYERLFNPAFQQRSEDAFVRWVLADQPEPPRYFARMKALNREGPRASEVTARDAMRAKDVEEALSRRLPVIDIRRPSEFAREHIPGTINIPLSKTFLSYVGTVLDYDKPLAIIARSFDEAHRALAQLALIGHDHVGIATIDVVQTMKKEGRAMASVPTIDPQALAAKLDTNGPRVVDVRGRSEWNHGHLPKATHIFLGDVVDRSAAFSKEEPIVVHCESGTRSSIAASLLMARGFTKVANLAGGFEAWREAGLPVSEEHS